MPDPCDACSACEREHLCRLDQGENPANLTSYETECTWWRDYRAAQAPQVRHEVEMGY